MSYVRVSQANGQSVAAQYKLQRQKQNLPVITIEPKMIRRKTRKKLQKPREVLNNIPILQGPKSYLREALKSLAFV
ncbi:MAG: hypothetical protein RJR37_14280 [Peptococcaceae bacterium MAG4]|nr:hypothetical protein [Peptococcaceae bacterium MAG4]